MANQLGKRYRCETCDGQLICTAAGDGEVTCCAEPMVLVDAAPLPSAD